MPSRFTFFATKEEIEEKYNISSNDIEFYPYYNLKPSNRTTGIINENGFKLVRLRWGYVKGQQFYKARGESIHEKKLFRKAFAERRCVILANGFFEWDKEGKTRTPIYFSIKNEPLFAIAGVYNSHLDEEDNKVKYQCSVITTEANEVVNKIFHRMPVIFSSDSVKTWLEPSQNQEDLLSMLKPYTANEMDSWIVNSLPSKGDNGPDTIKRVKKKKPKKGLSGFL